MPDLADRPRKKLLAMIETYEAALLRIADKPREYQELAAHEGRRPPNEYPRGAYRKCARIATVALWRHHPEMKVKAQQAAKRTARPGRRATKKRTISRKRRRAT